MSQYTEAAWDAQIELLFPDNTNEEISELDFRTAFYDLGDSVPFIIDDETILGNWSFTGDVQMNKLIIVDNEQPGIWLQDSSASIEFTESNTAFGTPSYGRGTAFRLDTNNHRFLVVCDTGTAELTVIDIDNDTGHITFEDTVEFNYSVTFDSTVDSSSPTTGSFHTDGGAGIAKNLYVGSEIYAGVGTTGTVSVEVAQETIDDDELRNIVVRGEHNGNGRTAAIGVRTHGGITNAVGYLFWDAEDGSNNYFWSDNTGDLRTSASSSHVGKTSGTVVGDQTSDERLKNIFSFDYGLDDLLKLEESLIRFNYKHDVEQREFVGLSAQKVQSIYPHAVYNSQDSKLVNGKNIDNILKMSSHQFFPLIIKSICELNQKFESIITK